VDDADYKRGPSEQPIRLSVRQPASQRWHRQDQIEPAWSGHDSSWSENWSPEALKALKRDEERDAQASPSGPSLHHRWYSDRLTRKA